jgi:hypothetical protein
MSEVSERDTLKRPSEVWGFLVACLVLLLVSAFLPRVLKKMPDFEVYWRTGARFMAATPLYRVNDGHFRHKYFPVFGVLMLPWAILPLRSAKIVWFYGSVAVLVGLVTMSVMLLPRRKVTPITLAFVTTAAMLKFFAHELNLGQCNALMALCVLSGFGFLKNDRPVLAGASLALSVAIKPYTVIFLPYLLLKRHLVAFGVFLAFAIVGLVLPAAIYGAKGNLAQLQEWTRVVFQSAPANLLNQDNVSIWAMYAKWLGTGRMAFELALGTIVLIAGLFLVLLAKGVGLAEAEYLEMAVLMALLPLLSPQGWDYVLLIATPAIMLLVNEFRDLPISLRLISGAGVALMALSVFDLMGRRAYVAFMSVSAITACALTTILSIAYLRLHRIA